METKVPHIKSCICAIILTFLGILSDQYTKYLAVCHLKNQESFIIWKGVFQLHYLENRGAAFGLMQNMRWIFVLGAVLVVLFIGYWYLRLPFTRRYLPLRVCAVLVCAGALGNLVDRLAHEYVIDFFYFDLIDFPIFNVADIYVVVACFLFLFLIFFYYKDEDFAWISSNQR